MILRHKIAVAFIVIAALTILVGVWSNVLWGISHNAGSAIFATVSVFGFAALVCSWPE